MGLFGLFQVIKTTALSASFFANIGVIGIGRAGWFKGSIAIGLAFLGPLVSGVLLNLAPFTVLFVVLALLTLLPVFVALAVMKDHPQPRPPRTLRAGLVDQMHSFKELIHDQRIYLPLATEALSTALFASFSTFIAVIAVQQLGLPPVTVSVLMSVEGIAFIFTLFVGVSLLQRFGTAAFYVASVAVVVTSLVVLVNAGSALALIIAAALLGLGLGLTNLFIADRIGRVDGAKGKVTGLFAAAVGIGLSAGPMSGGALASLFGTGATFLAFVPAFMLLAVVALQASVQHPSPRINLGASDRG
jgi:predicted MFS family arabinose efflux permease